MVKLYSIDFKNLELENLYKNYTNISTNKIMQIVKKKLSKIFIDQYKESLNSEANKQGNMGNKLRTYRKFKNLFKFEEYLQFGSKTEQQTYTTFRISVHDLRIERGRYEGLKVEDRICYSKHVYMLYVFLVFVLSYYVSIRSEFRVLKSVTLST
jgi:hypothetical protein